MISMDPDIMCQDSTDPAFDLMTKYWSDTTMNSSDDYQPHSNSTSSDDYPQIDSTSPDIYVPQYKPASLENYLPPCRICSKKASGFHYGANTCEACKGFYRRTLLKLGRGIKSPYQCERGDKDCPIILERNPCSFCRYQKCIEVGMSKKAIKQGRYTHARRAEYTKQMKGLSCEVKVEPYDRVDVNEYEMNLVMNRLLEVQEKHMPGFKSRFQNFEKFHVIQEEIRRKKCILKPDDETSADFLPNLASPEVVATRTDEEERRALLEMMTSGLDKMIRFLVEFVKSIPGFKEIPLADQAELLKASAFEFGYIGDVCLFNPDMKVMMGLLNTNMDKLIKHLLVKRELIDKLLEFARKMQDIRVTGEEITLLRAILVLFSDRCDVKNTSDIENIQLTMVQYLQYLTRHSKGRFCTLMGQLTALRELQLEQIVDVLARFKNESSFINSFPILQEVITPSNCHKS